LRGLSLYQLPTVSNQVRTGAHSDTYIARSILVTTEKSAFKTGEKANF